MFSKTQNQEESSLMTLAFQNSDSNVLKKSNCIR